MWVLAWFCAGLIPAAFFAARDGQRATARTELAIGLAGTGIFTWIGVTLW
jgi:hypothetical protein